MYEVRIPGVTTIREGDFDRATSIYMDACRNDEIEEVELLQRDDYSSTFDEEVWEVLRRNYKPRKEKKC